MAMIAYIVNQLINLYVIVLFATIISSWLVAFGILNTQNNIVAAIMRFCYSVTEPVMRPVRSMLPSLGGIDFSPIVVFIGLRAVQIGLNQYVFGPAIRSGF